MLQRYHILYLKYERGALPIGELQGFLAQF